jgi:hypothetical protein
VNPLVRRQLELNRTTRRDWDHFAGHRRQVTDLLLQSPAPGARLCVLGAGNCNDLHLQALAASFRQVVLVDLDDASLAQGVASQRIEVGDGLICLGNVDVTGALALVAEWTPATSLSAEDFLSLSAGADVTGWQSNGGFDVVASTCLLSQLIGSLTHSLTDRHPQFVEAMKALRTGHLRTIAALLKSGGRAILISDVVSSDTCPELLTASNHDAHRIVTQAIQVGNFFTGLNPAVLQGVFKTEPALVGLFENVAVIRPWLWSCGRRVYAVYAVQATRRADK